MPLTAFPETERRLARRLDRARIDEEALARPLARCDIAQCRGRCCHDGAILGDEEASVLMDVLEIERAFFDALDLDLPEWPILRDAPGRWRTALRDDPARARDPLHPTHFPATSCVFLLPDARCALQCLGDARGHHPWHWKPVSCWMHPLVLRDGAAPLLTLPDDATDPNTAPGYPGFTEHTGCGATCPGAPRALETLAPELGFLEALRDPNS